MKTSKASERRSSQKRRATSSRRRSIVSRDDEGRFNSGQEDQYDYPARSAQSPRRRGYQDQERIGSSQSRRNEYNDEAGSERNYSRDYGVEDPDQGDYYNENRRGYSLGPSDTDEDVNTNRWAERTDYREDRSPRPQSRDNAQSFRGSARRPTARHR